MRKVKCHSQSCALSMLPGWLFWILPAVDSSGSLMSQNRSEQMVVRSATVILAPRSLSSAQVFILMDLFRESKWGKSVINGIFKKSKHGKETTELIELLRKCGSEGYSVHWPKMYNTKDPLGRPRTQRAGEYKGYKG